MLLLTKGLVIREQHTGEDDRIITVLTNNRGLVRAFANGARRIKNKNAAATALLTFSRFSLYQGREKYIVNDSEPLEVFFKLRGDIERMALAQYFCELCLSLAPEEDDGGAFLRVMLNALSLLADQKRPPMLLKSIVELRLLALAGYMPDLTMCSRCGIYEADEMFFLPGKGVLLCGPCTGDETGTSLAKGTLTAMRHILYAELDKLFFFSLPQNGMIQLGESVERYLLFQLDRQFNTLTFYKSLSGGT